MRGAVGGTGHIVTRNRQDPSSEFNNVILLQSQGNGGLDKGGEGQENYFSKNFRLSLFFRRRTWLAKNNSNYFFSNHLVALSSVLLLSLSLSPTTRTKSSSVMQITPDSGREKKAIDAQ
jgi:hypothetical protein